MTEISLYNTLEKTKSLFNPENPSRVTMYVCGPTVYSHAHIGNARPATVFDVLFRLLRHRYGQTNVVYARNITDIDDKINNAAKKMNVPIKEITAKNTAIYQEDMKSLKVLTPTIEPYATDHIAEILVIIAHLVELEHAYEVEGHVLFNVGSFKEYGRLSNRNQDELIAGARVEVAPYKRNPGDFVLWKPSPQDLPGWDSPWGFGRPGWHIECSAMIKKHLGSTIDIHCGGHDLIFPHHENEIAQSQCCNKKTLANFWLHNGFLTMQNEKMSKSVGNIITIRKLLEEHEGETIRLALLSAHYRQPLEWSNRLLRQSKNTLNKIYGTLERLSSVISIENPKVPDNIIDSLADDLNTPKALAHLAALAKSANSESSDTKLKVIKGELIASGSLLGLLQQQPSAWRKGSQTNTTDIEELIEKRLEAKKQKNYDEADRIRKVLSDSGVILEDKADITVWRKGN
ncbi:MAG: cysteine--tRNA ligase [Rhodospirillaceae bacterium]|nr:cysteine--tRNA ligase [Rhodospirillaceae bacterium]